jgi:hypothetical protein
MLLRDLRKRGASVRASIDRATSQVFSFMGLWLGSRYGRIMTAMQSGYLSPFPFFVVIQLKCYMKW